MTGALIDTAISVSFLLLIVLILRRPVARHFGARAAYALWLAPLIRLIAPLLGALAPSVPMTPASSAASIPEIVILRVPETPAFDWLPWALGVWAAGALAYLAFQLLRHATFIRRALAAGSHHSHPEVPHDVIASHAVDGPLATGLIHPIILVPHDFETRFTPEQQRLALLHEQLHHRRGDIWASAAALIVTASLWFNPLAHLALAAFRRDMEAACDSSVLAQVQPQEAQVYAQTILRSAARPAPRSLCALTSIDELKGRLTMLNLTHDRGRRIAGLAIAGAICVGGAALAAPTEGGADTETRKFEKKIIIHEKGGSEKDVLVRREGEIRMTKCEGEKFEAGASGGSEQKEEIKFVLCAKPGESLLPALERAEAMIQNETDIPAERKAQILGQLRAKIAELRTRG